MDLIDAIGRAYVLISKIRKRYIDIIVGTSDKFDARRSLPTIEKEVDTKGKIYL